MITLSHERERKRLQNGPGDDRPAGVGTVVFDVSCTRVDAATVLQRGKAVLEIVGAFTSDAWPSKNEWRDLLPDWFVAACAPEMTPEQADQWLKRWEVMSPEEREEEERNQQWSLADWLHWMKPTERKWLWWDSEVIEPTLARVALEVESWPFPWGAFKWLMQAAGADDVFSEETDGGRHKVTS